MQQRIDDLTKVVRQIIDNCEDGFRQLGLEGPDQAIMGKIWFDTYKACKAVMGEVVE